MADQKSNLVCGKFKATRHHLKCMPNFLGSVVCNCRFSSLNDIRFYFNSSDRSFVFQIRLLHNFN